LRELRERSRKAETVGKPEGGGSKKDANGINNKGGENVLVCCPS